MGLTIAMNREGDENQRAGAQLRSRPSCFLNIKILYIGIGDGSLLLWGLIFFI